MNLFYLVTRWWELPHDMQQLMVLSLCNLHANKMLLETVQMLYTANHQLYDDKGAWCAEAPDKGYRATHAKHPVTLWALESGGNWHALLQYGEMLCGEYVRRFRGGQSVYQHRCARHVHWLRTHHHPSLDETRERVTEPPACVGDLYREANVEAARQFLQAPGERPQSITVLRYRLYYIVEKLHQRNMMGGYYALAPTHYKRGNRRGQIKGWQRGQAIEPPLWVSYAYQHRETLATFVSKDS